jgi:hypothetical protein
VYTLTGAHGKRDTLDSSPILRISESHLIGA